MLKFTIPLNPITKKNSQKIIVNPKTNKRMIIPSEKFTQYQNDCKWFVKAPLKPIRGPVNIKAVYYREDRRRVDLTNLHEALHDILVYYQVIVDDKAEIVAGTDGSRVRYDKVNPRTEIEISVMAETEGR